MLDPCCITPTTELVSLPSMHGGLRDLCGLSHALRKPVALHLRFSLYLDCYATSHNAMKVIIGSGLEPRACSARRYDARFGRYEHIELGGPRPLQVAAWWGYVLTSRSDGK